MKFVDSCEVDVVAGKGGNGSIAFRREKFVPFGGPSGGDGGRGGDVVFVADEGLSTLLDLSYGRTIRATNGEQGHGKDMYGRSGADAIVRVPVGTQIFDRETGVLLFDIDRPDSRVIVAKGGKGGRGNIHFATPYDRAPRRAEPGEDGVTHKLRLELKVMADVGLLGFPNVGKSTFIRAVSRARPKVADYPFTTLTPHLGVVRVGDEASLVLADIPGLIPGAAEGAGLGHRFLKHVERTRALLHLVTLDFGEERDPLADYDALMTELEHFDPELAKRPQIVAMTKSDLPEVREAFEAVRARFDARGIPLRLVSAATGEGIRDLVVALHQLVTGHRATEDWEIPSFVPEKPAAEFGSNVERLHDDAPPVVDSEDEGSPASTAGEKSDIDADAEPVSGIERLHDDVPFDDDAPGFQDEDITTRYAPIAKAKPSNRDAIASRASRPKRSPAKRAAHAAKRTAGEGDHRATAKRAGSGAKRSTAGAAKRGAHAAKRTAGEGDHRATAATRKVSNSRSARVSAKQRTDTTKRTTGAKRSGVTKTTAAGARSNGAKSAANGSAKRNASAKRISTTTKQSASMTRGARTKNAASNAAKQNGTTKRSGSAKTGASAKRNNGAKRTSNAAKQNGTTKRSGSAKTGASAKRATAKRGASAANAASAKRKATKKAASKTRGSAAPKRGISSSVGRPLSRR